MTAIDGVTSCSGMEYPMLTCVGGPRDTLGLYSVVVHETAHMWFPMQVGSNETRHGWQDEGLTRFNQTEAMREFFHGYDRFDIARQAYGGLARFGREVELMRHGDEYPIGSPAYGVASYEKMSLILHALQGILGDSTFLKAYREYGRRWLEKHPTPFDFWNTFEDVAGRDLDWFWRPWFYDTWTLDQAVASVEPAGDSTAITIEDRGLAPMPVLLVVTKMDGATQRITLPVEPWLAGARRQTVRVAGAVRAVAIDPEKWLPDVDRTNNVWGGVRP